MNNIQFWVFGSFLHVFLTRRNTQSSWPFQHRQSSFKTWKATSVCWLYSINGFNRTYTFRGKPQNICNPNEICFVPKTVQTTPYYDCICPQIDTAFCNQNPVFQWWTDQLHVNIALISICLSACDAPKCLPINRTTAVQRKCAVHTVWCGLLCFCLIISRLRVVRSFVYPPPGRPSIRTALFAICHHSNYSSSAVEPSRL